MDLHRGTFKMERSSYLPSPLASPALMVLASTAEAGRDPSIPCPHPRPFGAPVSMDKDAHIPFTNGSYTFASMYNRQATVSSSFPARDFPPSLLHLHPQFAPAAVDCSPIGMLSHSAVAAFRPFAPSPEERDGLGYQSAFTPAKRLKGCLEAETSALLYYTDSEGKEYDFLAGQLPSSSPGSLKAAEETRKKIFSISGQLSDRETSSSPEDCSEQLKKKASLYDNQAPVCPICQVILRPGEMQEHMVQEMDQLSHLHLSKLTANKDGMTRGTPKSLVLSLHIKSEEESASSLHCSEYIHQSDRYQTFLRVRANRQTRLHARIGKMKRQRSEEGQKECVNRSEDESTHISGENNTHLEEYEWCRQKRLRVPSVLERRFRGFVAYNSKENLDSDVDLDVDGDDTLEYGKIQYSETDVILCSGDELGEAQKREALQGASLNGSSSCSRVTSEFSKRASHEMPSTSMGDSSTQDLCTDPTQRACKSSDIKKIIDDSTLTTFEALKSRIRELEKQLSRGDRYKCLICMDAYTIPLTSIQCWHVHCEECWLRTLGAKKLCPQCNTITSPGDLRRVYL
ncbi:E3 ubiquitin-protein ligase RNF220 [Paramormyrops kingsleyae]|uniref:E3 ubiquitin-protein ligase RNF220 n=1 Tax=Paramormyrops kingsleyae TaxID=1676925 RepID=A0A3B3Q2J9_9TELE|nr:E3 ubiquitin-protein ligase RNF220-like [Paramormyrops kingsleyae]XP_023663164.1 E3 ubiquitin-protein ligase RNF220-like [Paramormyrops kingsleyae]